MRVIGDSDSSGLIIGSIGMRNPSRRKCFRVNFLNFVKRFKTRSYSHRNDCHLCNTELEQGIKITSHCCPIKRKVLTLNLLRHPTENCNPVPS